MGTEAGHGLLQSREGKNAPATVLLFRQGGRLTVLPGTAVNAQRIMAEPKMPALRQPGLHISVAHLHRAYRSAPGFS